MFGTWKVPKFMNITENEFMNITEKKMVWYFDWTKAPFQWPKIYLNLAPIEKNVVHVNKGPPYWKLLLINPKGISIFLPTMPKNMVQFNEGPFITLLLLNGEWIKFIHLQGKKIRIHGAGFLFFYFEI
jgi:hypothetical protein